MTLVKEAIRRHVMSEEKEPETKRPDADDAGSRPQVGGATCRPLREAQAEWRRAYLAAAYAEHGGNITRMATALQIDRAGCWRLLKTYNIVPPRKACEG